MMLVAVLFASAFIPMIVEARLAAAHDRGLRAAGAHEPADDVYAVMQIVYPSCFLGMAFEGWRRQVSVDDIFATGAAVFIAAKALKYWAIASLGERWTFRVLVPPGSSRIATGPYRWLRHPNYVAVVAELAGFALMAHAWMAGALSLAGFMLLLRRRIAIEERALGLRDGV